ncbi:MAG: hypothetical protein GEU94_06705 [Micromonosporaceae bacterium]|nr:hypothetical protein [Micromonosporaceae bacterium]
MASGFLIAFASPAAASPDGSGGKVSKSRSVPVSPVKAKSPGKSQSDTETWSPSKASWPDAGAASVDLPSGAFTGAVGRRVRAGDTVVWLGRGAVDAEARKAGVTQPSRARVEVLDRAAAKAVGVSGVLLRVGRADGASGLGRVAVDVDVSGFAAAFGGDWESRLKLMAFPGCVLTRPEAVGCATPSPLDSSRVNVKTHRVSGHVDAGSLVAARDFQDRRVSGADATSGDGGVVVAVVAASSASDTGDFGKTKFSSSYQWQAGKSGGDFSWSYGMDAPATPGGLDPEVSLSYSSGAVDGQTATKNVQPGWLGEGWSYSPGHIERSYRPCADDQSPTPYYTNATGDLCWRRTNARLVWGGKSTELVYGDDGKWRAADDDAAKVEKITGADHGVSNGDNDGEYWRVTTTDGTRFYFGRHELFNHQAGDPVTDSAWTVPVFANNSGDPCFSTGGFSGSWCKQAWRWNLDYVVDRHGNSMTYFYGKEQSRTGRNGDASKVTTYDRGGWLKRIEYGTRSGTEASTTAPARVLFDIAERCFTSCWSGTPWTSSPNKANWPDTPWDLKCSTSATSCPNNLTPSFWTARRLASVTAQIWTGSGTTYQDVNKWDLTHKFPGTGNSTSPVLWLDLIEHTGKATGGSQALPAVSFGGVRMQNRADYDPNSGMADPQKYRIASVDTETGGRIEVTYSAQGSLCQFGVSFPEPSENNRRCFPQYYKPDGAPSGWSWWHKYLVTKVIEKDLVGGSPDVTHSYSYSMADASAVVKWAHDDGPSTWSTPLAFRSWADWRGYPTVTTTTGIAGGTQTQTKQLYFRGLKNDYYQDSESRASTLTNSEGEVWQDFKYRAGFLHETTEYAAPGGQALERTIHSPVAHLTGTRTLTREWAVPTVHYSHINREARIRTRTWLPDSQTWQATSELTTFDPDYGVPVSVSDYGDTTTAADNICTRTWYARNLDKHLVEFANREQTVAVECEGVAVFPDDALGETRWFYDGTTDYTTAPATGNVTRTDEATSFSGSTPQLIKTSTAGYDGFGRTTSEGDALDRVTTTAYTEGVNGLTTTIKETNPKLHVTTTTVDPALGAPTKVVDPNGKTTEATYDNLARLRKVWLPGRDKATDTPNTEYRYTIAAGVPPSIQTLALGPNGNQISSHEIYDGLLRDRQTQTTAPDGKRAITDIAYDARGLAVKESVFYNAASAPTGMLVSFADPDVATQTRHTYDGLERQTVSALWSHDVKKWETRTVHGGDRVATVPPSGGTVSQEVFDVRGQRIGKRLYGPGGLADTYDATSYDYDLSGQLVKVTDPAGNQWTYGYDLLGRQTSETDSDAGATSMTYDNAGQLLTQEDSRDKILAYAYDELGRKTGLHDTSTSGTLLASWTYDTLAKGELTSSTRHASNGEYTKSVTGYDDGYRQLGASVTIPASEGALAGTYTTLHTYKADGSPATVTYPQAGGMAEETVTHTYTDTGHPTSMTGWDTYLSNPTYDYDGLLLQSLHGGDDKRVRQTSAYDAATRRLSKSQVHTEQPGAPGSWDEQLTETYAHDPAGNITSITETTGSVVANQCFAYDHLRRLTEAWTTEDSACQDTPSQTVIGGVDPYWQSYRHDKIGNRAEVVNHAATGDTSHGYTYSATQPHTVTGINTSGPAGIDSVTYGYDTTGNTTSRPDGAGATQTLTWNIEGRLSKVVNGDVETSFVHDADGDRLIRRDAAGNTALFLGSTEIRADAAGATSGTRYYGGAAVRVEGALTWLGADHHATGQIAIKATDLSVTRRRLDPYGNHRGEPLAWPGEKGFVNGTQDPMPRRLS